MTIPTNIYYGVDPVAVTATSNVIALTVPSDWTAALGNTGILMVEVTDDGESCALRLATSTAALALFPADVLNRASLSGSTNVVMRTLPIPLRDVTSYELICSSATMGAIVRWLPITEQGD